MIWFIIFNTIFTLRYFYHTKLILKNSLFTEFTLKVDNQKSVITNKQLKWIVKNNQYKNIENFYLFITSDKLKKQNYIEFLNNNIDNPENTENPDSQNIELLKSIASENFEFKIDLTKYISDNDKFIYIIIHSNNVLKKVTNKFNVFHFYLEVLFEFNYFVLLFYVVGFLISYYYIFNIIANFYVFKQFI